MSDNITLAGRAIAADEATVEGVNNVLVPREKVGFGAPGSYTDVDTGNPLPVREPGTYGYAAGTTAATVDVPSQALLQRVSVVAGVSQAATITIGGGATISVPAGSSFDEQIPGAAIGADVVIGGTVQAYYVSWVA